MAIESNWISLRELPKTNPQTFQKHFKITAVTTCFVVTLPMLTYIYNRWTRPTYDASVRNPPVSINPLAFILGRSLKGVDAKYLGFTPKVLNRVYSRIIPGKDQSPNWTFEKVCNQTLDAIRNAPLHQGKIILINQVYAPHILDFWPCGLEGRSYQAANDVEKNLSWLHQILQALVNDKYISNFKISEEGDKREIRIVR